MARVTYAIVQHDGGWAYRVDGTFSETLRSREAARDRRGAGRAQEQKVPGGAATMSWEDERGRLARRGGVAAATAPTSRSKTENGREYSHLDTIRMVTPERPRLRGVPEDPASGCI